MEARSMAELERMIMAELTDAMNEASVQMWQDTQNEVSDFYSQGEPLKRYVRTYTLEQTPDATPVVTSGKQVSFEIYLHDDFGYRTGSFSMADVLECAEAGKAGIKGKSGFWEASKKKMETTFKNVMSQHFSG